MTSFIGQEPIYHKSTPNASQASTSTRTLCAAMYLDPKFRNELINDFFARPDLAIAPNPGADAGPILHHALHARLIDLLGVVVLCVFLAAHRLVPSVDTLLLLTMLTAWLPFSMGAHSLGNRLNLFIKPYIPGSGDSQFPGAALSAMAWSLVGVVMFFYDGMGTARPLLPTFLYAVAMGLSSGAVSVYRAHCLTGVPNERRSLWLPTGRIADIERMQCAEVVVYRSGSSAFVGSGRPLRGRPITLPLRAPKGEAQPKPIDVEELIMSTRSRIESLSEDSEATRGLPDLEVFDQVFVSDKYVERPICKLKDAPIVDRIYASVSEVRADPTSPAYPYLRIQVSAEDGELVTNTYIRCVLQGETLYVEALSYYLPPTRSEYHVFKHGPVRKFRALTWCAIFGYLTMPVFAAMIPFNVADMVRQGWWNMLRWRSSRFSWRSPSFGAYIGIRELGTDLGERYFQEFEANRLASTVVRQFLEALKDYLRDKIDLSDLEEHIVAIVNDHSVTNYGVMSAGSIGQNSQANVGSIGPNSRGSVNLPSSER